MNKDKRKARKAAAENSESRAFRRGAVSTFILFHLVAIACWAAPTNFWLVTGVKELVRPYLLWTGLFQSWDTFAPSPPVVNSFVKAVVETRDGRLYVWAFPRMEELSYAERYRKERYRKFTEVMLQPNNAAIWPDVAQHIARMFNRATDPPVKVLLVQYQAAIAPGAGETATPKPNTFYEDYVQPEDLK